MNPGGGAAADGGATPQAPAADPGKLRIAYYNVRSIVSKECKLELERVVQDMQDVGGRLDVLCLQETFLGPKDAFHMAGWVCYRRDRVGGGGGGVMIMVRERLWSLEAENYLDGLRVAGEEGGVRVPQGEGIAVALPGFAPAVVVGCVYRPPDLSADATAALTGAMGHAAQRAAQKGEVFVLGGM